MKRINMMALSLAICCSTALVSCGTNEENAANEMQREAGTDLRDEPESQGTTPATSGRLSEEGQLGGDDVDADMTGPRIGGNEMLPSQKVVENVTSNNDLSVLAGALKQADLVRALNGTGPYTVFAPDNSAFEALPNDMLEDLMEPKNKQRLTEILNNHVVTGKLTAADLTDGATLNTASGQQLTVTKKGNDVMVNGAKISQADVMSENGVIHVIEKVLVAEK